MAEYHILGEGTTVLHETYTQGQARDWVRHYTRNGDFGGWSFITIEKA